MRSKVFLRNVALSSDGAQRPPGLVIEVIPGRAVRGALHAEVEVGPPLAPAAADLGRAAEDAEERRVVGDAADVHAGGAEVPVHRHLKGGPLDVPVEPLGRDAVEELLRHDAAVELAFGHEPRRGRRRREEEDVAEDGDVDLRVAQDAEQLLALSRIPAHLGDQGVRARAELLRHLDVLLPRRGFGVLERRDRGQDDERPDLVEAAGLGLLVGVEVQLADDLDQAGRVDVEDAASRGRLVAREGEDGLDPEGPEPDEPGADPVAVVVLGRDVRDDVEAAPRSGCGRARRRPRPGRAPGLRSGSGGGRTPARRMPAGIAAAFAAWSARKRSMLAVFCPPSGRNSARTRNGRSAGAAARAVFKVVRVMSRISLSRIFCGRSDRSAN